MYAIIKTGGKQFKVEKGSVIKVEKLDAEIGAEVTFEALLTASGKTIKVGKPVVKDIVVAGKVIAQDKEKKVVIFKYKPKKDYRKKQGHRQPYTKVEITSIGAPSAADAE
ncbi:MAG: 50S ribosomal protein L21 [Christensenellaceae bacterium]